MSTAPEPRVPLVIGVDAGGTATRCVVVGLDGRVHGRARGPGGNLRSSADPRAALRQVLEEALGSVDRRRVAAGHLAFAGAGGDDGAAYQELAQRAWREADLSGVPGVGDDLAAAVAGATDSRDAVLLLSGTGAVAALFRDGVQVARRDGYGWLLGDEGSGVWLGRQAVVLALAALDGRGPTTALVDLVPQALGLESGGTGGTGTALARRMVTAVHAAPPADLARLAPLVDAAARTGDAVAERIVAEGAHRLLRTFDSLTVEAGPDFASLPAVLAGGLLTAPTLLAARVTTVLRARGVGVVPVRDAAAGAAALAALTAGGAAPPGGARRLHRTVAGLDVA
ncbi:N-acetylglucosamine kinase [Kitasatospora terrestris]|uniref:ATPase BadF/BadG/BcrA/BcrD type domain-containing protein n=1 Tax=Kitasatospora terrestris TaxID=258051 RepID=A0ABP9DBI2_9ACTN